MPADGTIDFTGSSTVVLAAGTFPERGPARAALDAASAVVCCDGAAAAFIAGTGRMPDLAVGDGDSISAGLRAALGARFVHIPRQTDNDLAKAFEEAFRRGARGIAILGADGGRDDHFLANVSLLAAFAALDPLVCMITAHGRFDAVASGRRSFSAPPGAAVSVFAPLHCASPASGGLEWPLAGADLSLLHAGLSNRVVGNDGFWIETDRPVLVYSPFEE